VASTELAKKGNVTVVATSSAFLSTPKVARERTSATMVSPTATNDPETAVKQPAVRRSVALIPIARRTRAAVERRLR
jgi:hypothetical protein